MEAPAGALAGKPRLILLAVLVAALIAAGVWYWLQKRAEVREAPEEAPAAAEVKEGVGAEVFEKSNNPLSEELPETNPFNVDTNPFK